MLVPSVLNDVAGRHDKPDDRLRAAEALQLLHQGRQGRVGRAGAQHDQDLFLDVGQEPEDVEAGGPRDRPEHHHHEDDRRQVERADQLGERPERADAVAADREGHGPECPNRSELHDDIDRAEDEAARRIDHVLDGLPAITEPRQHASEQERDQDDRQDVAFCKRIDDRVRDHVQQELGDRLLLRLAGIGHRRPWHRGWPGWH